MNRDPRSSRPKALPEHISSRCRPEPAWMLEIASRYIPLLTRRAAGGTLRTRLMRQSDTDHKAASRCRNEAPRPFGSCLREAGRCQRPRRYSRTGTISPRRRSQPQTDTGVGPGSEPAVYSSPVTRLRLFGLFLPNRGDINRRMTGSSGSRPQEEGEAAVRSGEHG